MITNQCSHENWAAEFLEQAERLSFKEKGRTTENVRINEYTLASALRPFRQKLSHALADQKKNKTKGNVMSRAL